MKEIIKLGDQPTDKHLEEDDDEIGNGEVNEEKSHPGLALPCQSLSEIEKKDFSKMIEKCIFGRHIHLWLITVCKN